jgi:Protein of unknown function (DUF3151)
MNQNLFGEPEPTLLPADPSAALIAGGVPAREAAARHPASSLAWAALAEEALSSGETVAGYAYARTGYHRGLDALRGSGWKGHGPIPWEHEPNRGFLRALAALGQAAATIGEADEEQRCRTFLQDSSPTAATELGGPAG